MTSESKDETPDAQQIETAQVIRRQDLVDLGSEFTKALAPVALLASLQTDSLSSMQTLSSGMSVQTRSMRNQTWALWGIVLLALGNLLFLRSVSGAVQQQVVQTSSIQSRVEGAVQTIEALSATTEKTSVSVEAAEERALTQSTVNLVPELDPEKAKRAPMKLRIENPPATTTALYGRGVAQPPPPIDDMDVAGTGGRSPAPAGVKRVPDPHGATLEIPIPAGAL